MLRQPIHLNELLNAAKCTQKGVCSIFGSAADDNTHFHMLCYSATQVCWKRCFGGLHRMNGTALQKQAWSILTVQQKNHTLEPEVDGEISKGAEAFAVGLGYINQITNVGPMSTLWTISAPSKLILSTCNTKKTTSVAKTALFADPLDEIPRHLWTLIFKIFSAVKVTIAWENSRG